MQRLCNHGLLPDYRQIYEGGVVFSSGGKDLEEKIDYYLAHEEERKAIAQKGYELIQKSFTTKQRSRELYEIIKGVL